MCAVLTYLITAISIFILYNIFLNIIYVVHFPDSIRKSVKYNSVPEKDIDNCLGIWLSHAPFRIKKKEAKNLKQ